MAEGPSVGERLVAPVGEMRAERNHRRQLPSLDIRLHEAIVADNAIFLNPSKTIQSFVGGGNRGLACSGEFAPPNPPIRQNRFKKPLRKMDVTPWPASVSSSPRRMGSPSEGE